jgi:hypothetical protein
MAPGRLRGQSTQLKMADPPSLPPPFPREASKFDQIQGWTGDGSLRGKTGGLRTRRDVFGETVVRRLPTDPKPQGYFFARLVKGRCQEKVTRSV